MSLIRDTAETIESPFLVPQDSAVDLALVTHPRDLQDIRRGLPWISDLPDDALYRLLTWMRPVLIPAGSTRVARIGNLFLPRVGDHFTRPDFLPDLRRQVEESLELAERFGAKTAVLGGLVASVTRYGNARGLRAGRRPIAITTGHTVTALCVCATLEHAAERCGDNLTGHTVAIVGTGSIGRACALWLARKHRALRGIVLCDLPFRRRDLEAVRAALVRGGFGGRVVLAFPEETPSQLPGSVLDADIIISATNRPGVIPVERIGAGRILIDDSQPWAWSRQAALDRFKRHGDLLCLEGGLLEGKTFGARVTPAVMGFSARSDRRHESTIWSCLGEGLLMIEHPELPPTRGNVQIDAMAQYEDLMKREGLGPAALQCGGHFYASEELDRFAGVRSAVFGG